MYKMDYGNASIMSAVVAILLKDNLLPEKYVFDISETVESLLKNKMEQVEVKEHIS